MLPDASRDAALNEALFQCRDRLVDEGVDLTTYTAVQNAGDVAVLREALGYEQVNLLGLSYGTRLALTVMRDYPEGVRSVILDSTLPYGLNLTVEEPRATANAVEAVLAVCQSDLLCRLGYPDLRAALFKLVDDLNTAPLVFTATNADTGVAVNGELSGDSLAQLLFGLLYNRTSVGFIPALVYTLREGDTHLLETIIFPPGAPDRLCSLCR
jgi:pimeloyl-ACP methyl ester carboxylesterase